MNYTKEEILNLQNDPVFLHELQRIEKEGVEKSDLIALYDVLDSVLLFEREESERVNKIYEEILKIAFQKLHDKLQNRDIFSLDEVSEHLSLRALYEFGIDNFGKKNFEEAKEVFLALSMLSDNPEFRGAMQIHLVGVLKKMVFEEFVDEYIDLESKNDSYFLLYFKDSANGFLHENRNLILNAVREIESRKS
ncbi:hypothetical protein ThvES_00000870 [Thiovulum sp. ES]|nr:hypothetical protein ThvES_00000870 [Thiovulum sp. ES]